MFAREKMRGKELKKWTRNFPSENRIESVTFRSRDSSNVTVLINGCMVSWLLVCI